MNGLREIVDQVIQDEFLKDIIILFVWAFFESIIWPVPIAFILAAYTISNPANWYIYGISVTIGSISGAVVAYLLGKFFKDLILNSKSLELFRKLIGLDAERFRQVQDMYNKYGAYAIIIAAVSPIPYKLVTWVSGIMEYNLKWFVILSILGRGITFIAMALAFSIFGELANDLLKQFKDMSIVLMFVVIGLYLFYKFYKK